MLKIIETLNDPELVVKFQRACGIYPAKPGLKNGLNGQHGDHPSSVDGSSCNGVTKENGTTNGLHKRVPSDVTSCSESEADTENTECIITNRFLNNLFHFGAELGNELFYITFYPFWLWNVDGFVGRRICVFWSIFMYFGQAAKDVIRWPRPPSPPVFKLEKRYVLEYGFPSTHAMVGAGMPFGILYLTSQRYIYNFEIALIGAICWCSLVCCSRLYLGMHSVLDILAGLGLVTFLGFIIFPWLDVMDDFLLHSQYAPAVCIGVPLLLSIFYPSLDRWSTARGDTTLILSVAGGVSLAHWFCFQYGWMEKATTLPPYHIIPPSFAWLGQMGLRLAIGVVILISTRTVMKMLSFNLVCYLIGYDKNESTIHQRLVVELPYKFCTYFVLAFNAVYLAPQVFRFLGIERPTFFTEI